VGKETIFLGQKKGSILWSVGSTQSLSGENMAIYKIAKN